ncbi:MAG: hypothetical protein HKO66_15810 [Saprospiraceae bacterium]|nr:hypothetical protein [Bacteroidia bacterium]NNE16687.1 hypothetical protein [Saprospiraceae bacterium]NNL93708.1 hypothetical protein [Saprospiraceae bacterium]
MITINKQILTPHQKKNTFKYSPTANHFLSLVSGIDKETIERATVFPRSIFRFIPWYNSKKGGGAITLGSDKKASITFTENFFSEEKEIYSNRAYANNLYRWLRLSAHEVRHLEHAKKYRFFLFYLIVFAYQYILFGHDDAPLEKEADEGTKTFDAFYAFGQSHLNINILNACFDESLAIDDQIQLLDRFWNNFTDYRKNQKDPTD